MNARSTAGQRGRSGPAAADSRTRYMDAAEALFIERGYAGTSIRDVARRARSHLGTLHYFWGSKQALFEAVCARRFDPIQAEQLRRLRACRAAGPGSAAGDLAAVVRALIEPPLLVAGADGDTARLLYGRVLTEPSAAVMRSVREQFRESTRLFVALLRARCRGLDARQFYWRLSCSFGALIFAQSFGDRVAFAAGRRLGTVDWARVAAEVGDFIVRGIAAPPPPVRRLQAAAARRGGAA
ncbi:MAG: TetR family transcriptional regulator [Gammaproteobacteria bacterium]|nr:TetR family transcriptional regulator [Gammaproteobacteria bacterium]